MSTLAIDILLVLAFCIITLLVVYTARHYLFTLNRLFGRQRQPYLDIEQGAWPSVVVWHNCRPSACIRNS